MKPKAETLLVTLVQANTVWEDARANCALIEKKLMGTGEKMEVVILPEMFNTGFSMRATELSEKMDGDTVQWMASMARKKNIILAGSLIIEEEGNYFNRMIWMQPDGKSFCYDKRHLFAYAGEDRLFTSGDKRLIVSVKGWKLSLLVCYDLRFPVWARQQVSTNHQKGTADREEPEYEVLIYSANWPERRIHAWKTLLAARAIENQCFVVGVNRVGDDGAGMHYSGDSMIADPMGQVVYAAGDEEQAFTYTLPLESVTKTREKLPFLRDADVFQILT